MGKRDGLLPLSLPGSTTDKSIIAKSILGDQGLTYSVLYLVFFAETLVQWQPVLYQPKNLCISTRCLLVIGKSTGKLALLLALSARFTIKTAL